MKNTSFLNVFNIAIATSMLENSLDYHELDDDHLLIVAYDNTVWACKGNGVFLDDATLIQRIV